jgi:hypothetical protein
MSDPSKRSLSRDRAWACVMLNLSIPGLGSLKAGRPFAGIGEMVIVFTGLFLLGAWVVEWMNRIIQSEIGETLSPVPPNWLWEWGVAFIIISWIWTTVTCVSLVREAKAQEEENRQNIPPRLSDLPKPPKLP